MNDIKQVIAKNLISLRKKNKLTQNELAEKLNYSDNAISRWEHAEVTPSIETLEQIAKIYNVPLASLIEDNAVKSAELSDRRALVNKLAVVLISASIVWFIATISFVMARLIWDYTLWQIYIWSMPIVALVMMPFHHYWGRHIYKYTILTIFVWTLLLAVFLQFLKFSPWMWVVFILGIPVQIGLSIWAFVKPKPPKPRKQKAKKQKEEQTADPTNTK